MMAIRPRAEPIARLPTSPIKIFAGRKLKVRKARIAPIKAMQKIESVVIGLWCDIFGAGMGAEIMDRTGTTCLNEGALMANRQESRAKVTLLIVRKPLSIGEHDKAGEIVAFRAQRIVDPSAKAREARQEESCIHEVASWAMDIGA